MDEITTLFQRVVQVYRDMPAGVAGQGWARAFCFGLFFFFWVWAWEYVYSTRKNENYRSRNFLHDLVYWFYVKSGLQHFLFMAAFITWSKQFTFIDVHPFGKLPFPVQLVIYVIINDFAFYWVHRAQHHFKFLWAFHAVHHSQEKLTYISGTRMHPIEQIIMNFLVYLAVRLVGFDEFFWLPLTLVLMFQIEIEHSAIPWRFGPFYKILVSPVFHRYHHSIDLEYRDKNFGGTLSCWDYLFGTAVKDNAPAPTTFGVEGVRPASLWQTLVVPFRLLREYYPAPSRNRANQLAS